MNDAEKQRVVSAAIQTKLLRALASFATDTVVPGLSSVGAKERLLRDVTSLATGGVDDSRLLSELVCVTASLIEDQQTLPRAIESIGYVSDVKQSAFETGNMIGQKAAKTTQARKGGEAKARKLDPLKAKAVELANQGNYPSRKSASEAIANEIVELSRIEGSQMTLGNAPRTIAQWLAAVGWRPKRTQS